MSTLLRIPGEPAVNSPIRVQANQPQRILVADDEPCTRHICAEALALSRYQVVTVEDGAAAWDALQLNSFDLLITDNRMGRLTGIGLIEKLRAARMTLPVILMSGAMPTEELNWHSGRPMDATLLKPFTIGELLETVTNILRATVSARGTMGAHSWRRVFQQSVGPAQSDLGPLDAE